jgi:methyl-accepting chemotaxis protein
MLPVSRRSFIQLKHEVYRLMMNQAEVTAAVTAVSEKLVKIGTETQALKTKIEELTAAVEAQPEVSPELAAAVEALVQQAQVVDDLVQDA